MEWFPIVVEVQIENVMKLEGKIGWGSM